MKRYKIFAAVMLSVVTFLLSACTNEKQNKEEQKAEKSMFAMNTFMTFQAYGEEAQAALDETEDRITDLENMWSVTRKGSDIYTANHSDGKEIMIQKETADLISFALRMSEQTGGMLDLSIYPVLCAWGFTTDNKQIPSADELESLLENVDYRKIQLEGTSLVIPDGMQIDLGAVGKGYAADLVTEILKEHHVESALFSLGGNIQAVGSKPDGSSWQLGIRDPLSEGNIGILQAEDCAVVTSGAYENYFVGEDGKNYGHILNPKTGYPAENDLLSVTIISSQGRLSDALSTALYVMGSEEAEDYWRNKDGFEMILITNENEVIVTEGIAEQFVLGEGRTEKVTVLEKGWENAEE